MKSARPDYLDYRLEGMNLIEAAAGTGKTYTIQNLVVRFLLERRLPIQSLLVVTFTKAATAELRERIRSVLGGVLRAGEVLRAAGSGNEAPASCETLLLRNAVDAGTPLEECCKRLRTALQDFDEAPISTIHGFCEKVLNENAFESGVLFRRELVQDTSKILAEIGMDFYRANFYRSNAKFSSELARAAGITPESLLEVAKLKLAHPKLRVHPDAAAAGASELEAMEERVEALFRKLRKSDLARELEAVAPYLNKLASGPAAEAPAAARELLAKEPSAQSLLELSQLGRQKLSPRVRKRIKGVATETVLDMLKAEPFQLVDELEEQIHAYGVALKLAASEYIEQEFRARKDRDNILTFHDLLEQVHRALHESDSRLLPALRDRYQAGIVDEFQDTDPIQYEIFTSLFRRPGGTLYMVGDPRQAIYAFRGGDVATYRRAVKELNSGGGGSYTLATNYRSDAAIIGDVNRIFHEHAQPFADREIKFPHVNAPGSTPALLRNGIPEAHPLRIVRAPEANEGECQAMTVRKVAELLNDRTLQLPGRTGPGVRPGDIAILVLSNREADQLADQLRAMRIPAVSARTGNVFASEDARELLAVLCAVSSGDVRELPNLLVTPIGGWELSEIVMLQKGHDETRLDEEQTRLRELQTIWEEGSFIEFFNAMLSAYQVRKRYPALPRGERKLTNLLQLGDLLEQESARRGLSSAGLVEFLAERIASPDKTGSEEYEQLLETDRESVTLMTIHSSKGLEFPIVLLPGLQRGSAEDKAELFHNQDGDLEYDLSGKSARKAQNERLQELLRLAYVAVTRAKHACYIFWGKGAKTSALEWLFRMRHATDEDADEPIASLLAASPEPEIPPELLEPKDIPASANLEYRPALESGVELELPQPRLQIDENWQFVSYSSLSPQNDGHDTPFDYDERAAEPVLSDEPPEGGIFSIRGGAATGNAWHRIFELADFQADTEELRALALPLLTDSGVVATKEDPGEKLAITVKMVENVLSSTLEGADHTPFKLRDVPKSERLAELEFMYRFRAGFTTRELQNLLAEYAAERFGLKEWPQWSRTVSGGCLNGFIDLVFRHHGKYFILDWKSNRIGGKSENFLPERLPEEMAKHFYFLQYLIYVVATVKFLRMRLGVFAEPEYEMLFGGVFYLFLRGVSPEHPGRGVFYDRPPYELVRRLEEVIG